MNTIWHEFELYLYNIFYICKKFLLFFLSHFDTNIRKYLNSEIYCLTENIKLDFINVTLYEMHLNSVSLNKYYVSSKTRCFIIVKQTPAFNIRAPYLATVPTLILSFLLRILRSVIPNMSCNELY